LGVNVPLTMTTVFGIATALGGMSGILAAPYAPLRPALVLKSLLTA